MKARLHRLCIIMLEADTEPVIALCASILGIIAITLAFPGTNFGQQNNIMRMLVDFRLASFIAGALSIAGILSISQPESSTRQYVSFAYMIVFLFLGATFLLSTPISTGVIYFAPGTASFWTFLREVHGDK